MHGHACTCLNVRLDVARLLAKPDVQLAGEELEEPLFSGVCQWAELGADGVRTTHPSLLQQHTAGRWTVTRCLVCGNVTHATCSEPGVKAVALSGHLLSDPSRIAALQRSPSFSAAFGIVLPSSPRQQQQQQRPAAPPVSPRSHPTLTAAMRSMKLHLGTYLRREEARTEAAIQAFRDEKLRELKENKQRAMDDSQAFASLLLRLEDQMRLDVSNEASGERSLSESEQRDVVAPLRSQAHRSGGERPASTTVHDTIGVFVMDGDDIELGEEADEQYGAVQEEEEEEVDTDDSGVEEPRRLAVPRSRAAVPDLARSLPVHIPVPADVQAPGPRRRRLEPEDEAVPDIDQMADSIRQLAQSLHTEPGMFADLPRPRTNTMNH